MTQHTTKNIHLSGSVDSPDFEPWIERHAAKLGLRILSMQADPGSLKVTARGAAEMLDAFALACSLGPIGVWVEHYDLKDAAI